jgi:hypothetical protein
MTTLQFQLSLPAAMRVVRTGRKREHHLPHNYYYCFYYYYYYYYYYYSNKKEQTLAEHSKQQLHILWKERSMDSRTTCTLSLP